jgi:hypothetical protein
MYNDHSNVARLERHDGNGRELTYVRCFYCLVVAEMDRLLGCPRKSEIGDRLFVRGPEWLSVRTHRTV